MASFEQEMNKENQIKELHTKYIGMIDKEIQEQTFDNFSNVPRKFQQIKTTITKDTGKLIIELPNIPVSNLKLRVFNPFNFKPKAKITIKSGNCIIDMVKINMLMGNIVMDLSEPIENVDNHTWISLPFFKNSYISGFNTVVLVENANFLDWGSLDLGSCELFGDVLELRDLQNYNCLSYQNKYITECFNNASKGRNFSHGLCLGKGWDTKCRLSFCGPICSIFVYMPRHQTELVNDIHLMIDDYELQMQKTEFGYQIIFSRDPTSTINFSKIDNAFLIMNTYIEDQFDLNVHAINLQVSNRYGQKYAL